MNQINLFSALVKVAELFTTKMAAKVVSVRAPRNIIDSTSIQPPIAIRNGVSIRVVIGLKENEAPAAGAYEWGSGIHATRGGRGKYIIKPKQKAVLALPESRFFPQNFRGMERSPKFAGYGDNGYLFYFVEHPGVEARPYIEPTLRDSVTEFRRILGREFKAEILRDIESVVIIRG